MWLYKWHTWIAPCLICYFIVTLFYIALYCYLATNLKSKNSCLENFSILMLQMEVLKCWKIVEFPKIAIAKRFTKPKQRSALKKQNTDICFQIASRMQFLGDKKWCSANIFSDTKQGQYFQKKNSKYEILNHLYFGPNLRFLGDCFTAF